MERMKIRPVTKICGGFFIAFQGQYSDSVRKRTTLSNQLNEHEIHNDRTTQQKIRQNKRIIFMKTVNCTNISFFKIMKVGKT